MLDVAVHQTREAVAHADDIHSLECRANGCRADDAVDTRGGPAAHEDCQLLVMLHARPPTPNRIADHFMIEGGSLNGEAARHWTRIKRRQSWRARYDRIRDAAQ